MNIIGTRHFKWKIVARWIGFIVIPGLFVVLGMYLKNSRGPYWSGSNYDPDYAYLMNALNVIEDLPIGHIDHTGTPVQLFSALVIKTSHLIRNGAQYDLQTLETDVLIHPELYLQAISYTLLIINSVLLLTVGIITYGILKNYYFAIILQSTPFLSSFIPMYSFTKVAPEGLLLTIVLLLICWLVVMLGKTKFNRRQAIDSSLVAASIVGLGIATKVNFLPMLIVPLFIIQTIRLKLLYFASTIGFFFLWTWPIRSQYNKLFHWFGSIFQHTGIHGSGTVGVIDWPLYWNNLQGLIDGFPRIFEVIILFLLVSIVSIIVLPQRRQYLQTMTFRVGAAAIVSQLLSLVMIAKHMRYHYFIPFIPLTGIIVCCILMQLRNKSQHRNASGVYLAVLFIFIFVQSIISGSRQTSQAIDIERQTQKEFLATHETSAGQYSALQAGNNFAYGSYTVELQE